MASKRVFLLERDGVEAGAVASLIEQCGHQVAGVAHGLEDAVKLRPEALDFALLERDLGDGTDATPISTVGSRRIRSLCAPRSFTTGLPLLWMSKHRPRSVRTKER